MFIVVSGNVGSGKTTLVKFLSKELGYHSIIERAVSNPYFKAALHGNKNAIFFSQLFFLLQRSALILKHFSERPLLLLDRTIYEDGEVFAKYFYSKQCIDTKRWEHYKKLYGGMKQIIPKPDLLIYLKIPPYELYKRVGRRNGPCDRHIQLAYLQDLDGLYEKWIKAYDFSPYVAYSEADYGAIVCRLREFIDGRARHEDQQGGG